MKLNPDIAILAGLLFVFDVDYPHDQSVIDELCSIDVNDSCDLSKAIDLVIKPDYLAMLCDERKWYVETIKFYLGKGDSFESILKKRSFLFFDEVLDGRSFMNTLLGCLERY